MRVANAPAAIHALHTARCGQHLSQRLGQAVAGAERGAQVALQAQQFLGVLALGYLAQNAQQSEPLRCLDGQQTLHDVAPGSIRAAQHHRAGALEEGPLAVARGLLVGGPQRLGQFFRAALHW
jgi:hypothetical protein